MSLRGAAIAAVVGGTIGFILQYLYVGPAWSILTVGAVLIPAMAFFLVGAIWKWSIIIGFFIGGALGFAAYLASVAWSFNIVATSPWTVSIVFTAAIIGEGVGLFIPI